MTEAKSQNGLLTRALDWIEMVGNKLPDPAVLFLILMIAIWIVSWPMSSVEYSEIDPRSGEPIRVVNQLTGSSIARFMSSMVSTFTGFHPLGVVLVALLGVGVAEHTGFINAGLKWMLGFTPPVVADPDADPRRDRLAHGGRRGICAGDTARAG